MKVQRSTCVDGLGAFLKGYGEHDPQGLAFIGNYSRWRELAETECARRAAAILQSLSLPEVEAIAAGGVDFAALARQRLILVEAG